MPAQSAAGLDPRCGFRQSDRGLLEAGRGFISGSPELTLAAFAIAAGLIAGFAAWAFRGLRRAEAAG